MDNAGVGAIDLQHLDRVGVETQSSFNRVGLVNYGREGHGGLRRLEHCENTNRFWIFQFNRHRRKETLSFILLAIFR